jgi:hypothetical protein
LVSKICLPSILKVAIFDIECAYDIDIEGTAFDIEGTAFDIGVARIQMRVLTGTASSGPSCQVAPRPESALIPSGLLAVLEGGGGRRY